MRAMLRANSSTSAEPPLTGSDGALTVTPQFVVPAQARLWPFETARSNFTHNRGETHQRHSGGGRRSRGRALPVKPSPLTLLWSYWGATACFQLLELAAILP